MRRQFYSLSVFLAGLGLCAQVSAQQQAEAPVRAITNVTGDLYRAQNNFHYTVFLVTSDGIILADPINEGFAEWLKAELASRFDVPVRYVVHSHYHQDHASGGDVFADTAERVAHENMAANVLAAREDDDRYDAVQVPDRTYSDRTTISLGGKTVELFHSPPSHSSDMTVLLFPEERVVFAVDFIAINQLPFRTIGGGAPNWITAVEHAEGLDFDIVVPGHGMIGTKADVTAYKEYLVDLVAAVSAGIADGRSLEELQQSVLMEEYEDWDQYDAWRVENIQGAYEYLTGSGN